MKEISAFDLYRSTWQARKASPQEISRLQIQRLNEIVQHARQSSRLYAELYRDVPDGPG